MGGFFSLHCLIAWRISTLFVILSSTLFHSSYSLFLLLTNDTLPITPTPLQQSLVETNAHWSSLGALKADVAEALVVELAPIREEAARLLRDRNEIDTILGRGADYARERAQQTLDLAHQEMGLLLPKRSHSSMNPKL